MSSAVRAATAHRHRNPEYHWEGFGRKSTKPPWYANVDHDGTRRPLEQWEGGTCGFPRVIHKIATKYPPFVHSRDDRAYRPDLPHSKAVLNQTRPAGDSERQILARHPDTGIEHGVPEKYAVHTDETVRNRCQMRANLKASLKSTLKAQIYGEFKPVEGADPVPAEPDAPDGALAREEGGPRTRPSTRCRRRPTRTSRAASSASSQEMPLPYSRIRSEFAHCVGRDALRSMPTTGEISHLAPAAIAPPANLNRTHLRLHRNGSTGIVQGVDYDLNPHGSLHRRRWAPSRPAWRRVRHVHPAPYERTPSPSRPARRRRQYRLTIAPATRPVRHARKGGAKGGGVPATARLLAPGPTSADARAERGVVSRAITTPAREGRALLARARAAGRGRGGAGRAVARRRRDRRRRPRRRTASARTAPRGARARAPARTAARPRARRPPRRRRRRRRAATRARIASRTSRGSSSRAPTRTSVPATSRHILYRKRSPTSVNASPAPRPRSRPRAARRPPRPPPRPARERRARARAPSRAARRGSTSRAARTAGRPRRPRPRRGRARRRARPPRGRCHWYRRRIGSRAGRALTPASGTPSRARRTSRGARGAARRAARARRRSPRARPAGSMRLSACAKRARSPPSGSSPRARPRGRPGRARARPRSGARAPRTSAPRPPRRARAQRARDLPCTYCARARAARGRRRGCPRCRRCARAWRSIRSPRGVLHATGREGPRGAPRARSARVSAQGRMKPSEVSHGCRRTRRRS